MAYTKISPSKAKGRKAARAWDGVVRAKKQAVAKKLAAARARAKGEPDTATVGMWIALADPGKTGTRKLKFGQVVVANTVPDPATVWSNVDAGQQALKRATEVLIKPGITLALGANIPRFKADTAQPGMLVRELNGTVQRGRIVDGSFVPAD